MIDDDDDYDEPEGLSEGPWIEFSGDVRARNGAGRCVFIDDRSGNANFVGSAAEWSAILLVPEMVDALCEARKTMYQPTSLRARIDHILGKIGE